MSTGVALPQAALLPENLILAIKQTGEPARLNLTAACSHGNGSANDTLNGNTTFTYKSLELDLSPVPLTGINAVRHFLRDDPQAAISRDRSGMIRVTICSA